MIGFANAKINIGLKVGAKRDDGFHDILTNLYPIPWYDVVEIIPSTTFQFESAGLAIPGTPDENLCKKAYIMIREKRDIPGVHIFLLKNIPLGAGLGAGSSDGVTSLHLLNKLFSLEMTNVEIMEIAGELGSDCPFFVENTAAQASGRGEILTPLSLNLSGKHIVVVSPGIEISTRWAYNRVEPVGNFDMPRIDELPIPEWNHELSNDFQAIAESAHPGIKEIREKLNSLGADYSSLTGSGSAVFGLFDELKHSRKDVSEMFQIPEHQLFVGRL